MGIYDREYIRNEGPSFLEAISRWGMVCKWLIIINAGAYVLQLLANPDFTDTFDLNTAKVMGGQVWRLLTAGFLHSPDSMWHILFNMLFLWWFGTETEDLYGPREFLTFYLCAVLVGSLAFLGDCLVRDRLASAYGASGAVTAVMVLYACHFPSRVIYLFMMLPVPVWVFVVFQVAQDTFGLLGAGGGGNTGFSAHLGGAAFGFVCYKFYSTGGRLLNLLPDFRSWWSGRKQRPRLRIYREEDEGIPQVVPAGAPPTHEADEHFEAKQDAILEKISRFGSNSLTDGEREFMKRAAERAKARVQKKKHPEQE